LFYNSDGYPTFQQVSNNLRTLFDQSYSYDAAGNLIEKRDSVYGTERLTYDIGGRLTGHLDPQGFHKRYLADPVGDLLKTRLVQRRQGEQGDALWSREGECEGVYYRFDCAGNLVWRSRPDGDTQFVWDANQRLVETITNGRTTTYGYDPLGRRVSKKTEGTLTYFFWDGDSLLSEVIVAEEGDHGLEPTRLREWVYYPGTFEPLFMLQHNMESGQQLDPSRRDLYFYFNEPNGCPTRLLGAESEVLWSARYDAWGNTRQITVNQVSNPLRLQGQYYDLETDLCYNRARYYDPTNGFFISRDPIGLAGGLSLYQYGPNTWRWSDPLGLSCSIHFNYAAALGRELFNRSHWMREIRRISQIEDMAARYGAMDEFMVAYRRATGIEIHVLPAHQARRYDLVGNNWGTYRPAERRIYMNEGAWYTQGVNPVDQLGHEVGAAELDRVMGIPKEAIPRVHGGQGPYLTHVLDMMY
jgi:RHS repeat-associated protein